MRENVYIVVPPTAVSKGRLSRMLDLTDGGWRIDATFVVGEDTVVWLSRPNGLVARVRRRLYPHSRTIETRKQGKAVYRA